MKRYEFTRDQRELLERMQVPLAIYQYLDKRVVTLVVSDGFCKLFDYEDRAQAYFDSDRDLHGNTHPDDKARVANAGFLFATKGGPLDVVYRSRKGDDYRIIHAVGDYVTMEGGVRLAQVWYTDEGKYTEGAEVQQLSLDRELSQAVKKESQLNAYYYDYLTGLPCIAYFFELAGAGRRAILKRGEKPLILFMDLSGLKHFNREHGFSEGDKLLRAFSRLLVRYFSNENCSRFGQDHFAVFCADTGLDETLQQFLRDAATLNGGVSLPVRIGVYRDWGEGVDVGTACDRAHFACNSIRSVLESRVCVFDSAMLQRSELQQYVIANLDRAISEKWIEVYYQPIVRAVNGRVCDEEALARWHDPTLGMLSPAQFIPALEDSRLIYKLDLYMVDQVLDKLKRQERVGLYQVPQSVNLSRSDFDACDIVEEIRRRVDESGLRRELLTIEVTESMVGSDYDFMREQVERFRALGFPVWMDDFGSGYSSLDLLQSIHFDLIKFDMRFMQTFDEGDAGRVILSELIKMANALNIDTVCEGVETERQVQFLREAGCSKLQGFFYCKPIPPKEILARYQKGIQIGFEDPEQSAYFEAIGRVNLYDLSTIVSQNDSATHKVFSTLPMAVIEVKGDAVRFIRSNEPYRQFMRQRMGFLVFEEGTEHTTLPEDQGAAFLAMIRRCSQDNNRVFIQDRLPDGSTVQSFIRWIAANPVTGTYAVAVAVLSVMEAEQGTTYADIARALAADYFDLYYVDLNTDKFIAYTSNAGEDAMSMERHGEDFFGEVRKDAVTMLYPEDQERFFQSFNKENILRKLDEQGTFTLTYRLLEDGEPIYVNMKVMRMRANSHFIVIAVSNIDVQMRQKAMLDRIRQDQITYARLSALSGSFICLYTVELASGHYSEFSSTSDYSGLGFAKQGEDFFADAHINGRKTIYFDDLPRYLQELTRDKILKQIESRGVYTLRYRLSLGGAAVPVELRAAIVNESDGEKLIVGVNRLEADAGQEV